MLQRIIPEWPSMKVTTIRTTRSYKRSVPARSDIILVTKNRAFGDKRIMRAGIQSALLFVSMAHWVSSQEAVNREVLGAEQLRPL